MGGLPGRTYLHRLLSLSPVPLQSWLWLPGSGGGGRQGLLTSFCRRANRSPGALPPLTPRRSPLPALRRVMCMGEMAPARPQDEALARSLPSPSPAPALPKALKGPDCAGEVSERQQLDEYMKGSFVQVTGAGAGGSGAGGLPGSEGSTKPSRPGSVAPWHQEGRGWHSRLHASRS